MDGETLCHRWWEGAFFDRTADKFGGMNMALNVWLFWIPKGLEPLSSFHKAKFDKFDRRSCDTLCDAVGYAIAEKREDCLPWIRAGSGQGASVFNWQAILLLNEICVEKSKCKCGDRLPDDPPPI